MILLTFIAMSGRSEATKVRRSEAVFDELFGDNSAQKSSTDSTDMLSQMTLYYFWKMTGSMDGSLIDKAFSYGCWCQISGSSKGILPGKGQPVDELDKICKSLSQCRSCTAIDNRDSGCDPNNVVLEVGMSLNGGRINCLNNLTPCSRNNCECDEQFAFELHKMNPDFVTEYDGSSIKSGFNHVSECRIVGENSGGEDHAANGSNSNNGSQCCGEYPNRFLFNPLGGERACCRNVTYNTYKRECCNNSFLTSVGTCQ